MEIYDRKKKQVIKIEDKKDSSYYLYNTFIGRFLLKVVLARPWFSKFIGIFQSSRLSKGIINPFVKRNNIDISYWNISDFNSFNEFFRRKKDIEVCQEKDKLISIADAKLSVYKIDDGLRLKIKKSNYSLEEILGNKDHLEDFKNGLCLVFRLCVDDYHRYIFMDNGVLKDNYRIKGELHTVRPISEKYKVFSRNSREVSVIEYDNLGKCIQVEVGALLVGKIVNNDKIEFIKGEEKGYFEFGGSTIVLLLKENSVVIDRDIMEQIEKGREVQVSIGEIIGKIRS